METDEEKKGSIENCDLNKIKENILNETNNLTLIELKMVLGEMIKARTK